jgi:nucleoside-diphosphate-sugar epimerase
VIDKNKASVLDEFRKVNTEFSVNLANSAAKCGVKRFIFLSSIRSKWQSKC